jgi:hypothetical protein
LRDSRTALMVMLSVGLVGTWVYHLYDKTQYSNKRKEIFVKDSLAVAQDVKDSLQKIYSLTINNLDAQLDSSKANTGMLKGELSTKLSEIYRLRSEISAILKRNDTKKEDLVLARKKTAELQQLVLELESRNNTVEEEKQQIASVLDKVSIQVKSLEGNMQQLSQEKEVLTQENKVLTEKVNLATAFVASEVKLAAVVVKNNKEIETNNAGKAEKMIVSFAVQNNVSDYENAEVYIIVTSPDGSVMKPDAWESSSALQTKSGEKKIYTRKIKFEYQKGEAKRLFFSLNPDEYSKGSYSLQLYHNGYMIAQSSRMLN